MATETAPAPAPIRARSAPSGAARALRREYAAATLIILALTLAFFAPLLRGQMFSDIGGHQTAMFPWRAYPSAYDDRFPQSDQADTYYPWEVLIGRSVQHGTLPLWNPHNFGGQPFLANGQNGAFYPPKFLLALTLPADWVHDLLVALSIFASGVTMFALMKGYGCGFAGALLAAVAWMLNPYFLAWLQLEITAPIAVFLPLATLCVHRAMTRRSWRMGIAAGGCIGMMFLGCSLVYAILVAVACGVYACALWLRGAWPILRARAWRRALVGLVPLSLMVGIALGLGAVQTLPALVLVQQGSRAPIPYARFHTTFAVPTETLLASFRSLPLPVTAEHLVRRMAFVGLPVFLLALVGLAQRRRAGATFARALLLIVALIAAGTPLAWVAYQAIPGMRNFQWMGRALFFWGFGMAILAGIGLDATFGWARAPHTPHARCTGWLQRHARAVGIGARLLATVAIGASVAQLGVYGRQINPPFEERDAANLYPQTPLIRAILDDQWRQGGGARQRVLSVARPSSPTEWHAPTLYASQPLLFGIESAGGYDSLLPDRTVALWRVVEGKPPEEAIGSALTGAYTPGFLLTKVRFDLLPRLGVTTIVGAPDIDRDPDWTPQRFAPLDLRHVYAGNDGLVFDIAGAEPRAYLVHRAERAASPLDALQRFTDPAFDYRNMTILETAAPGVGAAPSPAPTAGDGVTIAGYGTNGLSLDVTATQPGWVVLNDMWSPGWVASVNGAAASVLRANFAFRAVAVPAGTSRIEMHYRPAEFFVGAAITGGTSVTIVALLVILPPLRRRTVHAVPASRAGDGDRRG